MRLHSRTKLILVTLTAICVMSLAVDSATAGRLSTTNTRFRVTWNAMRLVDPSGESGLELTCRVTLEGSFHSATIRKVAGALIGSVSRGIADSTNCRGSLEPMRLTVLQETLPWHVTYESFTGTLPNITSITFLLSRYAVQFSGTFFFVTINCLYRDGGNPEENIAETATRNTTTGAITVDTAALGRRTRLFSGGESCPPFGSLTGEGQVFLLGSSSTRISVTLI